MKNGGFLKSQLMCMSTNAVANEAEQQEIVLQRSFDSNKESSSSSDNQNHSRRYVSLSELNQNVEVILNAPETAVSTKLYNVVDLDDDVSSDKSGRTNPNIDDGNEKQDASRDGDVAIPDESDVITVEPSKEDFLLAWSHISRHLQDELQRYGDQPAAVNAVIAIQEDDNRTQGSDNSKCSFGFEKPLISKKKTKSPAIAQQAALDLTEQPVLDKTPSKLGKYHGNIANNDDEQNNDNTTCTWSESADCSIPTVIYIRRDIPPAIPDDEALGQNYTAQQLLAIQNYTRRIHADTTTPTSASKRYFMKGIRILTLGAIGSSSSSKGGSTPQPPKASMKKIHLDDDASEAFHQTLVDI